ncbi:MAG TPA: hypothetical protein VKT75_19030, partial [Acidobacteriaceae bacterium]|nr:hypothetical protein [Acidobacteriaceae bacterium]
MSSFLPFAELCDALAATTKKLEKRALIASYLQSLPVDDAGRAALWLSGTPFPETDPRVLNIGGALLQKAVLQLAATNAHALSAAYRRHGDIGAAAADLLYGHAPAAATLTLADVDSALAALAEARGPAPKLRLLLDLLSRATPEEAKYLIKLATGDMRTGVKQSLVEEAIAEAWPPEQTPTKTPPAAAVRRATMLLGSLPEVVALAAANRLADARMKLFHPIGFMLASPVQSVDEAIGRFTEEIQEELTLADNHSDQKDSVILSEGRGATEGPAFQSAAPAKPASESLVSGHDFSRAVKGQEESEASAPEAKNIPALRAAQLEDKFDGIRAQLHIQNSATGPARIALYSRNRDDLSPAFPDLVEAFS